MKKFILMVAAALTLAVNVNAQEGYEDTKHEVAIAFGVASNTQLFDAFEEAFSGYSYDNDRYMEPISAEYIYHVNKMLGLGAIFTFGNHKQDVYNLWSSKKRVGKSTNSYYTLMPAAKFNFLRKKNFGLYSKAGLGVTYQTRNIEFDDGSDDDNEKVVHLNWQLTLIGIEAGSPYLRAFAELGIGEQGVVCAGLRYKF